MIPWMFFQAQCSALQYYMNSIKQSKVVMTSSILATAFHIGWCYLLVKVFKWDIHGVAFSNVLTNIVNLLILELHCYFSKHFKDCYFWFTEDTLEDIGEYIKIGCHSALMVCLEWWTYEILALSAGWLGV